MPCPIGGPLVGGDAAPYSWDMVPEAAEVERALLALAPEDRVAVIERGLLSLDDDEVQAEVDAAWLAEINHRVDRYVQGDGRLVDADEHFAQVRMNLAARDR